MLVRDEGFCHYLYQGQTLDSETRLAYSRFRYYLPEGGVYCSQDPIRLLGGTILYSYVHDVNTWIDVFGLSTYKYDMRAKRFRDEKGKFVSKSEASKSNRIKRQKQNEHIAGTPQNTNRVRQGEHHQLSTILQKQIA
jgi:RHS repeat-associated protein